MQNLTPESPERETSGMETLLEEFRKNLEEDLVRKLAEKEREYEEGVARLDVMTQKTFEIVRQEEEKKFEDVRAFEEDLRNSCASVKKLLYEKATDPLRIQKVTRAVWPHVIGEEQMNEERGESS
jgi:hypothetical protein